MPRAKFWIASRSLSSGARSRGPLARNDGETYRPVFTLVQSRLMTRCVAGSRAVITNSFLSVASSG